MSKSFLSSLAAEAKLRTGMQFSHVDMAHAVTHAYIYGHTLLAQAPLHQEPFLREERVTPVT